MALPPLIINRQFMVDFAGASAPCFAIGLVKTGDHTTGFMAVKPEPDIPRPVLAMGMGFGHSMMAIGDAPLGHFAFDFYGFSRYSALVNPANPIILEIIERMIAQRDYFFFILDGDRKMSAFRSEIGAENLAGMRDNLPMMRAAQTSDAEYEAGAASFRRAPDPPGCHVLDWVCRDGARYADLETDAVSLPPIG